MKYMKISGLFIVFSMICMLTQAQEAASQTWSQFRGNQRNGITPHKNITDTLPRLVWKKQIGSAFSEVLVQENTIYTMASEKIDSLSGWEYLLAYNASTGEELWKTKIDSIFIDVDGFGDGPRATPSMDHENIYCLSSFGKLMALSLHDGSIRWTIDFVKEFESTLPRWAFSSSPLLLKNELIVETGGSSLRGFASIDKTDGKINWIKGMAEAYYCSPTLAHIENEDQYIFANDSMLTSFDKDGRVLWEYRMPLRYPTAMPLFIAPDKIFVSTPSRAGCFMAKIEGAAVTEVFKGTTMQNHFSSSVYKDDNIYGFSNATLRCISAANGEIKWSKRGLGKGSLIRVGDKLLVLSDKGVLKIVEASPENYKELGSIQALEGKSWTAPSYANGHIYVRNLQEMASYKL